MYGITINLAVKIYNKYGLELERKTIGSNINLLIDLGYDIVKGPKGGYCLYSRLFDVSEVKFLIDAIYSSKTLNGSRGSYSFSSERKSL